MFYFCLFIKHTKSETHKQSRAAKALSIGGEKFHNFLKLSARRNVDGACCGDS
jgi:hypothetical protein